MKTSFEELKEEFKDCFEGHTVSYYHKGERLEHLVWRLPGHSNGYMEFIVGGGTLFVKGDYGDAVYQWYPDKMISLRWLSQTNLDYFAEKCQASEYGRDFKCWDSEELRKHMTQLLDEMEANYKDYGYGSGKEVKKKFDDADGFRSMDGEFEWMKWLDDNAYDIFGDDWWEFVPNGKYLAARCILHWVGLKLAVEKLEEQRS